MSETIVCGVDGEPHSLRALQVANELAMRSGRRLELLHITSAVGEPARRDRRERLLCTLCSDLGRPDPGPRVPRRRARGRGRARKPSTRRWRQIGELRDQ